MHTFSFQYKKKTQAVPPFWVYVGTLTDGVLRECNISEGRFSTVSASYKQISIIMNYLV